MAQYGVVAQSKAGIVDVWFRMTNNLDGLELNRDAALLDQRESDCRDRFRLSRDRRDYTAAHALLRRALSRRCSLPPEAWRFDVAATRKPIVDVLAVPMALDFSLSHTRGAVACAVGQGVEIGIDVETIDQSLEVDALAEVCLAPCERVALAQERPSQRSATFVELWTLKEAYVKAIGLGLSSPLASLAFEFLQDGTLMFHPSNSGDGNVWQFALFAFGPGSVHRLAIALRSREVADDITIDIRDAEAARGALPLRTSRPQIKGRAPACRTNI
jgi:4'-phosphopantetheinyl transferase